MVQEELKNIGLPFDKSDVFGNVDGLSLQNLFYSNFGVFPSCYLFDLNERRDGTCFFDSNKLLEEIIKHYGSEKCNVVSYKTKMLSEIDDGPYVKFCIIVNNRIYARFERDITECYVLYNNKDEKDVLEFIELASKFFVKPKLTENTYYRLCTSNSGYYLNKGKIKFFHNFNVEKQYNDDFMKEHKKITSFIEENDKSGLVILHGEKGTGKSTYIKYLVHTYPEKKFVYVPANLVTLLGDPSFGSFLTTLDNHIIVLEDCENVIQDRKTSGTASSVSLLLNLTDGILSDDLGMKFICTFNDNMKNIDTALLRKGRLVSKYEFKPLSVEKATALLNEMDIEADIKKPMALSDIFNFLEESYDNEKKSII